MSSRGYELSKQAEDDIRSIAEYTIKTWGTEQAQRYILTLEDRLSNITDKTVHVRTLFPHWPELQFCRCEHHYAFFIRRTGKPILVLAVWHEKMDVLARARTRLLALIDTEK